MSMLGQISYWDLNSNQLIMRKSSQNKQEDDQIHTCQYCGELAELMCGKCQETYYCKSDHQRADWTRHNKNCQSITEKKMKHYQDKRIKKSEIFEQLAKTEVSKALKITGKLVEGEKSFAQTIGHCDVETEIELGSSICMNIRLLIVAKEFSMAQDVLHQYFKEKNSFLSDCSNVCSKEELQALEPTKRQHQINLIQGKFRLITALAHLMHQLIRNSLDMFEILIKHAEIVYGGDSLELSNIYFYAANYLNFLNQANQDSSKALACFLKCAKLRKEKGGTALYNAALLFLRAKRKKRALQYFQKALQLIEQQKNNQNLYLIPHIYQNLALLYMDLGMTRVMMDYFQKAYFFYLKVEDKEKADAIGKIFMLIRTQSKNQRAQDLRAIEFPKEKKEKKAPLRLSSRNFQHFKNGDKVAQEDDRKIADWMANFREMKPSGQRPSTIQYPVKELQYLFGGEANKANEEQVPSYLANNDSFSEMLSEGLNMDLAYMRTLSSNEVAHLHELNRLLIECRERAAIYDIVENSNFYQTTNKDKLNRFYKLNPGLVRPSDLNRMMMIRERSVEEDDEFDEGAQLYDGEGEPSKKVVTPRLDLTKLKQFYNG